MTGAGRTAVLVVTVAAVLCATIWWALSGGAGQSGDLDSQVRDIASRLRCLQCQGLSVWDSNTESSLAMRDEIRRMLEAGMTREQIIGHYVDRYGEGILLVPPLRGFSALVYLLPAALLGLGVWWLRGYLRAAVASGRVGRVGPAGGDGAAELAAGSGPPAEVDLPPIVEEALDRYRRGG